MLHLQVSQMKLLLAFQIRTIRKMWETGFLKPCVLISWVLKTRLYQTINELFHCRLIFQLVVRKLVSCVVSSGQAKSNKCNSGEGNGNINLGRLKDDTKPLAF